MRRGARWLFAAWVAAACAAAAAPAPEEDGAGTVRSRIDALVRSALGPGDWSVEVSPEDVLDGAAAGAHVAGPPSVRPGRNYFQVRLQDGERSIQRILTVDVSRWDSVWVSTRSLPHGAVLTSEDVEKVFRRHDEIPSDVSVDDPAGLRLRYGVSPSQILTRPFLEEAPLLAIGQRVRLRYTSDALEISTLAEAREEGRAGDVIRVRALGAREECRALVSADGTVEVVLP